MCLAESVPSMKIKYFTMHVLTRRKEKKRGDNMALIFAGLQAFVDDTTTLLADCVSVNVLLICES